MYTKTVQLHFVQTWKKESAIEALSEKRKKNLSNMQMENANGDPPESPINGLRCFNGSNANLMNFSGCDGKHLLENSESFYKKLSEFYESSGLNLVWAHFFKSLGFLGFLFCFFSFEYSTFALMGFFLGKLCIWSKARTFRRMFCLCSCLVAEKACEKGGKKNFFDFWLKVCTLCLFMYLKKKKSFLFWSISNVPLSCF